METTIRLALLFIIIILVILVYVLKHKLNKNIIEQEQAIKKIEEQQKEERSYIETTVKEVMTPRTSIFALNIEETIEQNLNEIVEQGFSRIPLYRDSIDNIVGVLYIKDILKVDKSQKLKTLSRKAMYVPESMRIYKMFEEFKIRQSHMAIIIDEYGGTAGIVTIEDILEEIVGEIRDEYDVETDPIVKVSDNLYDILGDTLVEEINEQLDIKLPLSDEYDTISGLVQSMLGKVANKDDQVKDNGFVIKVTEVENKRIEKVRLVLTEIKEDNFESERNRNSWKLN